MAQTGTAKQTRPRKTMYLGDPLAEPPPPELLAVLDPLRGRDDALVTVLQRIQGLYGYLPARSVRYAARELGVPLARMFGVATFYNQFRFTPPGRVRLQPRPRRALQRPGARAHDGGGRGVAGARPARGGGGKAVTASIRVGTSTCGLAAGAEETVRALQAAAAQLDLPAEIKRTGGLGACHREPLGEISTNGTSVLYGPMEPAHARELLAGHFGLPGAERPSEEWVVSRAADRRDYPYFAPQVKVTTVNCGVIDPLSLDDYLAAGGYEGLRRALALAPEAVIAAVQQSKLRGRGGAGYPTGVKWEICRNQPDPLKYLVCNADEGDPGAFMDRTVIEGDPHRVLEGMGVAAGAIGARRGDVYVRAAYPLAGQQPGAATAPGPGAGYLGTDILGSGLDFDIIVKEGAGAFVCGEETALMHSIEGKGGTPRLSPPYPAESGLWGHPTNINNVETYASVPSIMTGGAAWVAGPSPQQGERA